MKCARLPVSCGGFGAATGKLVRSKYRSTSPTAIDCMFSSITNKSHLLSTELQHLSVKALAETLQLLTARLADVQEL